MSQDTPPSSGSVRDMTEKSLTEEEGLEEKEKEDVEIHEDESDTTKPVESETDSTEGKKEDEKDDEKDDKNGKDHDKAPTPPSKPSSPTSPVRPPLSSSAKSSPISPVPPVISIPAARTPSPSSAAPSPSPSASASFSVSPSSPNRLAPSAHPPRRSSLPRTLLTPAQGGTRAPTPPAPIKSSTTRAAPDLAEFDPFATPAPPSKPVPPPKDRERSTRTEEASPAVQSPSVESGGAARPSTGQEGLAPPAPSGHRRTASRSHDEPQFNFAGFLRDLRTKSADPVARYLKSFLTNFAKKPFMVNEQIKLIRDFLAFIADKMRAVEPWKSQSAGEFDNALEAMEKLVMNRLYPYTFTPQLSASTTIMTDDLERDAVFAQRVRLFRWVQECHLDVPEGEQSTGFLTFAEQELLKINHYKAPRDKMICILNCCKVIFGLIRHTQGNQAGADAFVPILIFVVLRAAPENMLSNVEYINRFRNPEKLQGEAGYYLSSLQGAIAFIETMDASSLSNITQEEFESNVEQAIRDLPSSPTSPRAESATRTSDMSPFATSPGEEPAAALALPATAAALDGTKRFFQRTGDAAKEAVSRPLSAIGKILETMQAGESDGEESVSGDEDWRRRRQEPSTPVPQPQPPSRLLASLGLSPGGSESTTPHDTRTPTPDYPGAAYLDQHAQYGDQTMSPQQRQYYAQQQAAHAQYAHQQHAAQMQSTLSESQEAFEREQARLANVTTLQQMFPALDEEIVDAVLYSCGDDLGTAIDRLLEM